MSTCALVEGGLGDAEKLSRRCDVHDLALLEGIGQVSALLSKTMQFLTIAQPTSLAL